MLHIVYMNDLCYSCRLCTCLQVKVLYVRNLMLTTTESDIEEAFSVHAPVERVKKIKDYAFVHFHSKEDAHKAMNALNGNNIIIPSLCVLSSWDTLPEHCCASGRGQSVLCRKVC